jgi:hypothetical protein
MIDVFNEKLLTMVEAAAMCPTVNGKRPHAISLWRWATKGQKGVKLEHVQVGRYLCTSETALNDFFREVAKAPAVEQPSAPQPTGGRTDNQRELDIARAEKDLEARGVLPNPSGQ